VGLWLARLHRVPWIADFRDPWVSDAGGRPRRRGESWFLACEREVYRRADRVLANAPNALESYCRRHPGARAKIRLLTNGFDPRPGQPAPPPRTKNGVVQLVHAGEIYVGRDPRPLLDAMSALRDSPPWPGVHAQLHILGRAGRARDEIERAIQERGLADSVVFRGQVSYQEALDAMAAADINVLFDTPNRRIGVPAKLYEYFGAQRPVLALAEADGDTAAVLRDSGLLHRIAHPRSADEIRGALAGLMNELAAGAPAVVDAARLTRFTRQHLTEALAQMMDEVLAAQ
jgi:glycosyltransferase involved in cell wall biosynthesis